MTASLASPVLKLSNSVCYRALSAHVVNIFLLRIVAVSFTRSELFRRKKQNIHYLLFYLHLIIVLSFNTQMCICVPMPTHCTITCFGFRESRIDGEPHSPNLTWLHQHYSSFSNLFTALPTS